MSQFTNSIYRPNPSGRLGASVFAKNRFGVYERMFVVPLNPQTDYQINRRSEFAALSRKWGDLTDEQRSGWDERAQDYPFTKNGQSYTLTGFMFFMFLNSNLQIIGEPIIEDDVRLPAPQTFTSFSVDIVTTPGTEDITLNIGPAINSDTKVQVWASKILKPGRKVKQSDMKFIGCIDDTFASGDSIKTMYLTRLSKMPGTGDKVVFQIKATNIADGYTAYPLRYSAKGAL